MSAMAPRLRFELEEVIAVESISRDQPNERKHRYHRFSTGHFFTPSAPGILAEMIIISVLYSCDDRAKIVPFQNKSKQRKLPVGTNVVCRLHYGGTRGFRKEAG